VALLIPQGLLHDTFGHLRGCGRGLRECQVLWISPWSAPDRITGVVHPEHRAHAGGFEMDSAWLSRFWICLAECKEGVRVQVHTHPGEAFHSAIDDMYPVIHSPGFLSLVIPRFAQGDVSFNEAFLAELNADGDFREIAIHSRLKVVS